jgi:N-acetylneuraminic acid mutarotase
MFSMQNGTARLHAFDVARCKSVLVLRWSAAILFALFAPLVWAQSGSWGSTGSTSDRIYHTATLLANGKVLIAGGGPDSTELYDPATGGWTTTPNSPQYATYQTAELLNNGKVLLAAGAGFSEPSKASDLYDPATGLWGPSGNLSQGRYWHSSVKLANGKVLVMGGKSDSTTFLKSAEIYDPANGTWSTTGSMATGRALFPAVLLNNGKVLVAGGYGTGTTLLKSAEIYNPANGTWSAATALEEVRAEGLMLKLNDGRVLIAGGKDPLNCTWTAEIYDPASGSWSWIPNMHYARGGYFTMTMMPDGQVLVAGGVASNGYWNSAELYDPHANAWKRTGALSIEHVGHTATLLPNGQVLLALGNTDRVELYGPPIPRTKTDFNGDQKSDIVFSNGVDMHYLFAMNGHAVQSSALLPRAAPGWHLAGMGDFDANGSVDLLWQNGANPSQYWIYLLSNHAVIGGGSLIVAPGYRPTFVADFNGDGKADILFENGAGGRWIFFMNGASIASSKPVPAAAPGWVIAGVGDFNGDHHADLLWMNAASTTQYWIFLMTNGSVTGGGGVTVAGGYIPTRIADFNGDGKDDILWEDHFGSRWFFFMNGASLAGSAAVPSAAPGWNIVGAADFDNNHSADLLWQSADDPTQFWMYLLSGGHVIGGGGLGVAQGYLPTTR